MTRTTLALLATIAATAVPAAVAALPPASAWEIGPNVRGRNYSIGMPASPSPVRGGGVAFEFPRAGGEIDAMTLATAPLRGARSITLRYRIDAPRGTRFIPSEAPEETATVSLYFQQRGDNWSARGRYQSFRWYSPPHAVIPLTPGETTVTVRLDEGWTNVWGVSNGQDPDGFAGALADTARIGLAFGSLGLRSHGVFATGPARFTLLDFDVR